MKSYNIYVGHGALKDNFQSIRNTSTVIIIVIDTHTQVGNQILCTRVHYNIVRNDDDRASTKTRS